MRPRSNTLFHFTRSLNKLSEILKHGFWPRYCLEDIQWAGLNEEYVAFPMVCFCDIPISRISEHVDFYGSFGIGLSKEWGIRNHLNPIMYVTGRNPVHAALESLTAIVRALSDESSKQKGLRCLRYILAHTKPMSGRMIVSDTLVTKDFYQESEWRFVPSDDNIKDFLLYNEYNDIERLEFFDNATKAFCQLKFSPPDVRYIFVPADSDIPVVINFLQTELEEFPSDELKVLMSRVISLERIQLDL